MKASLKKIAYAEAAALLAADMDDAELGCAHFLSEVDEPRVRERIRNVLAPSLQRRADRIKE